VEQVEQVILQLLRAVTVINVFFLQSHLMAVAAVPLLTRAVMLVHQAAAVQELVVQVEQPQVVELVLVTQAVQVEAELAVAVVEQELLAQHHLQI
jgi:hypothetical protein